MTVPGSSAPRLSIGMPVYNGADSVAAALESLRAQSFRDFELIVSDNASTDATEQVCRAIAATDARMRYVRQPRNIGPTANFEFVLGAASAPLFMWAAGDDRWHPRFVEAAVALLDADPHVMVAATRVDMPGVERPGTKPIRGHLRTKLRSYLAERSANTRFYGVWRTAIIRRAVAAASAGYVAADWAIVIAALREGDAAEVPEVLMERSRGGASDRTLQRQLHAMGASGLDRLLPLWSFTRTLARLVPARDLLASSDVLLRLHLEYTWTHWSQRIARWLRLRKD